MRIFINGDPAGENESTSETTRVTSNDHLIKEVQSIETGSPIEFCDAIGSSESIDVELISKCMGNAVLVEWAKENIYDRLMANTRSMTSTHKVHIKKKLELQHNCAIIQRIFQFDCCTNIRHAVRKLAEMGAAETMQSPNLLPALENLSQHLTTFEVEFSSRPPTEQRHFSRFLCHTRFLESFISLQQSIYSRFLDNSSSRSSPLAKLLAKTRRQMIWTLVSAMVLVDAGEYLFIHCLTNSRFIEHMSPDANYQWASDIQLRSCVGLLDYLARGSPTEFPTPFHSFSLDDSMDISNADLLLNLELTIIAFTLGQIVHESNNLVLQPAIQNALFIMQLFSAGSEVTLSRILIFTAAPVLGALNDACVRSHKLHRATVQLFGPGFAKFASISTFSHRSTQSIVSGSIGPAVREYGVCGSGGAAKVVQNTLALFVVAAQ